MPRLACAYASARQEVASARQPQIQHLHDVAVGEAHRDVGLVDQHVSELRIRIDGPQNPLQHDRLLKALVPLLRRQKDLGHPAVGKLSYNRIAAMLRHDRIRPRI
jgi:hypothetical protein